MGVLGHIAMNATRPEPLKAVHTVPSGGTYFSATVSEQETSPQEQSIEFEQCGQDNRRRSEAPGCQFIEELGVRECARRAPGHQLLMF